MKMSSKLAAGVGGLAAVVGLGAAILTPVAGLALGAYFTYGAVAATMSTPAAIALSAAGAFGGLLLGRIAAPVVAIAGLGFGAAVGFGTKLVASAAGAIGRGVASIFDRESRNKTGASFTDRQMMRALDEPSRFYGKARIAATFNSAGLEPANENRKAPKPEPKVFRRFSL